MRSIASPAITARSAFAPITTITSSQFVYLHADHLDTPRFATDALQRVVWRWRSDAFVIGTAETDPDSDSITTEVNLRFPGQYSDPGTGLYYNYFRDYDSATGRYVQSDPIGLTGGMNTYVYGLSAPSMNSDPFGLLIVNNSSYPVYYRDEKTFQLWVVPPHCKADVSIDGAQNPTTGTWTKFYGGKWYLRAFGSIETDVTVGSDGTPACVSGQCASRHWPINPTPSGQDPTYPWKSDTVNGVFGRRPDEAAERHPSTVCHACTPWDSVETF